jgi:uncharacterized glyoxalase superfamily protein PhnB
LLSSILLLHDFLATEFSCVVLHSGKSSVPTVAQSVTLNMNYTTGVEAVWAAMVDAGFKVTMPLDKQFWGAIYGRATCPYGHSWSVHQHVEESSDPAPKKAKDDATTESA